MISKQREDGSYGSSLYTDWAAAALSLRSGESKNKIKNYLKNLNDNLQSATDYERRALALMALGVNPYTGTKVNYIQKIIDQFDGAQIGDSGLVNDDIFAIFPLIKAGYTIEDEVIEKTVNFILDEQKANGSFSDSIDLTASGIQALVLAKELNGTASAVENAKNYLLAGQQSDGGFGSSFSTSWALQAIDALGDSETEWLKNAKSPKEYLASLQQSDGGLENENEDLGTRVWATAYAIPGFYGKPWSEILLSFSKQEMQDGKCSVC